MEEVAGYPTATVHGVTAQKTSTWKLQEIG